MTTLSSTVNMWKRRGAKLVTAFRFSRGPTLKHKLNVTKHGVKCLLILFLGMLFIVVTVATHSTTDDTKEANYPPLPHEGVVLTAAAQAALIEMMAPVERIKYYIDMPVSSKKALADINYIKNIQFAFHELGATCFDNELQVNLDRDILSTNSRIKSDARSCLKTFNRGKDKGIHADHNNAIKALITN